MVLETYGDYISFQVAYKKDTDMEEDTMEELTTQVSILTGEHQVPEEWKPRDRQCRFYLCQVASTAVKLIKVHFNKKKSLLKCTLMMLSLDKAQSTIRWIHYDNLKRRKSWSKCGHALTSSTNRRSIVWCAPFIFCWTSFVSFIITFSHHTRFSQQININYS